MSEQPRDHEVERSEPTFGELVAALKSLDRPETGISKHLSTIIVGAVLAIGVWTVSSVNASQVTMGEIKVTVEASAKQIDTLITHRAPWRLRSLNSSSV